MASVNPYVHFNGNCEEAFKFYQSVFGTELAYMMRFKEAPNEQFEKDEMENILHICLTIGRGTSLLGSDVPRAFGPANIGNNFYISVDTDTQAEADKLFNGLSEGGKVVMPIDKTFWGAYFGMFIDKFNVQWMISYDLRKDQK